MKIKSMIHVPALAGILLCSSSALLQAGVIPLASTMNGSSYLAEDFATGVFSRINAGTGAAGDRDGFYRWNGLGNPGTITIQNLTGLANGYPVGTAVDVFPDEVNFVVGSISFDETLLSGSGVETVPITGIDLSNFWSADPNRTVNPSVPTVTTDISDHALGLWFFNGPGGIIFGALDANDTVTFTDGGLTSIDLSITTSFTATAYANTPTWNGTFSISGNGISYQINDTESVSYSIFTGTSRLRADITGTVTAVGDYEPW